MFLNKLVGVFKSSSNVIQLTSKMIIYLEKVCVRFQPPPFIFPDFLQKYAISSTPTVFSKLTQTKSQDLWSGHKDPNPVDRINAKLQLNEIGRLFAIVHVCGKQFKVTAGDVILIEGYWEPTNGDQLRLDKVKQINIT